MSNDDSPQVPAPSDRREAVREKAQQVQVRQSRQRLIRRAILGLGAAAVVAVAAVVVTWAFTSLNDRSQSEPATATDDGFAVTTVGGAAEDIAVEVPDEASPAASPAPTASPSASATPTPTPSPSETEQEPVEIRVYLDYLSPGSREFQVANVDQLSKWVRDEAATLTYYPVAMLTAKSNGTKYSLRAANAAACVATHSADTFFAFNNELLETQPEVNTDGMTDAELATLAIASGIGGEGAAKVVTNCINEQSFALWVKSATDRALQGLPDTDGIALTGTPTVLVNGEPYVGALDDPKEFAQFVLTVASDAYYDSASPSPTPSASPSPSESTSATPTPTPSPSS